MMLLLAIAAAQAATPAPARPAPDPPVAIEHGYHRTGAAQATNNGRHSGRCRFATVRGKDVRVCR